jgi:hypothetical protein
MSLPGPIRPGHSQAYLIWWEVPLNIQGQRDGVYKSPTEESGQATKCSKLAGEQTQTVIMWQCRNSFFTFTFCSVTLCACCIFRYLLGPVLLPVGLSWRQSSNPVLLITRKELWPAASCSLLPCLRSAEALPLCAPGFPFPLPAPSSSHPELHKITLSFSATR